jgi:propanol-preferring alcohol dehydrogenase
MLEVVSKNNIKVKTNPFNGINEVPKAVELAHSGKMQGKPVILIDNEALIMRRNWVSRWCKGIKSGSE